MSRISPFRKAQLVSLVNRLLIPLILRCRKKLKKGNIYNLPQILIYSINRNKIFKRLTFSRRLWKKTKQRKMNSIWLMFFRVSFYIVFAGYVYPSPCPNISLYIHYHLLSMFICLTYNEAYNSQKDFIHCFWSNV